MNAYQMADILDTYTDKGLATSLANTNIKKVAAMLRQQADKITDLERSLSRWQEQSAVYRQDLLEAKKLFDSATPVAWIRNGSLEWHIPNPQYSKPIEFCYGEFPLYTAPQHKE